MDMAAPHQAALSILAQSAQKLPSERSAVCERAAIARAMSLDPSIDPFSRPTSAGLYPINTPRSRELNRRPQAHAQQTCVVVSTSCRAVPHRRPLLVIDRRQDHGRPGQPQALGAQRANPWSPFFIREATTPVRSAVAIRRGARVPSANTHQKSRPL